MWKIFKKKNKEDMNVWEILDYYMSSHDYRILCEKDSIGKCVRPPPGKLDSAQNRNLRYKSNLQWEENFLRCLKIYHEFTGKVGLGRFQMAEGRIFHMKRHPELYGD